MPQTCLCKMRQSQVMGQVSEWGTKERTRLLGHNRWPHTLFRFSTPERLSVYQPRRSTQVLGMWKSRPWGSRLPLSGEGMNPSLPTSGKHGRSCWQTLGWRVGIPTWYKVLRRDSMWEFPPSRAHTSHQTTHLSVPSLMYIIALSIVSLMWVGTLAFHMGRTRTDPGPVSDFTTVSGAQNIKTGNI